MFRSTLALLSAAVLSLLSAAPATSQEYPSRAVTFITPSAPGGGTDFVARALAKRLEEKWGKSVIVENVPGASGTVGTRRVALAEPDGYTLLIASEGIQALIPHLNKEQPYDAVKDFAYIATVADAGLYLAVRPDLAASNLNELIEMARKQPETITYGTTGFGSINHLVAEMIQGAGSFKLRHVPYKGTQDAIAAMLGGHLDAAILGVQVGAEHVRSGKLRALLITSAKRSPLTPDVPTVEELGLPDAKIAVWWGIAAPARVDRKIVDKINSDVNDILAQKDFQDLLSAQGAAVLVSSPDEFAQLHARDYDKWRVIVERTGLEPK